MFYLFLGKDTIKSRKKMADTIASFSAKNPNSNVFRVSAADFDKSSFSEYLGNQSLFGGKFLIACDGLLKDPSSFDFISEHSNDLASSQNVFIFLEEELKKNELSAVEGKAEKIFKFDLPKGEKEEKGFNVFSISDAFGEKDKKRLWIIFEKAKREGLSGEEVFYKIVWQIKNMLLAGAAEDKGDIVVEKLKMSPFVLSKAKKYAKKFSKEELEGLYSKLVRLYHDSRRGEVDFDLALESFILSL